MNAPDNNFERRVAIFIAKLRIESIRPRQAACAPRAALRWKAPRPHISVSCRCCCQPALLQRSHSLP